MVVQERPPGLAGRTRRFLPTVARDRAVADHDAELEQLAPDPLGAPEPVLARDGRDQLSHFGTETRTAALGAGLPPPEEVPALPMPAHIFCEPGPTRACPKCAAEHAVALEDEVLTWADPGEDGRDQQPEQFKHALSIADLRPRED